MTEIIVPEKNIDLEQLGLINQGLFLVDGELAQRYNAVLREVFGFECDIDSFRVDKRGLSPEVAEHLKRKYPDRLEFGENYLNIRSANRFMVVVSPDQKNAPLVFPQTSYENSLFDEVYRQARHTIEDLTSSAVLFGELDNGINIFRSADDLLQFRTVKISLDSLEGTARAVSALKELSDSLGENDNALNEAYIKKMRSLVERVGSYELRAVSDIFPIKKEVHCFYVEFFKGVHCLRNFRSKDGIRTIFISHHQGKPKDFGDEILSFDLHEPKLLKALRKFRFIKYNPELIDRRIEIIEDDVLLQAGIDVVGLRDYARKSQLSIHQGNLPKTWQELRDLRKVYESTKEGFEDVVEEASYETRLKLAEPVTKDEIINHMLAEIDPSDPVIVYQANPRKFRVEFPTLALNRQRYAAYQVLSFLKGGSE